MKETKSPCIKECNLVQGSCSGCLRSVEEITNWLTYSEQEKQSIKFRIASQKVNSFWPDLTFPPINLPVLHSAKWL